VENTPRQTEPTFQPHQPLPNAGFFFDLQNPQESLLPLSTDDVPMDFGEYGDAFDWASPLTFFSSSRQKLTVA
jgi:hypothetical protein